MTSNKARIRCSWLFTAVLSTLGIAAGQVVNENAAPPAAATAELTEAERIVALQRLIEMDRERLIELEQDSREIAGEFERLSSEMGQLDEALVVARARLDAARGEAAEAGIAELEAELARLEAEREKVRTEFDLVIERRKAIDRQLTIIPAKVQLEQQGLNRLTQPAPGESAVSDPRNQPSPAAPPGEPAASAADRLGEEESGTDAVAAERVYDPVVANARKALVVAEGELQDAEERAQLLDRGLDLFQADLAITRDLLESERRELEIAQQDRSELSASLDALLAAGAPASDIRRTRDEIQQAESRADLAQARVSRYADRLELITVQVDQLQQSYDFSVQALRTLRRSAEQARERLDFAQSPFAPHRLARWAIREGVAILVVLALMGLLWTLAQVVAKRVVMALARRGHRGTEMEREDRAQTLKRVFQSVAGIVITAIGGLAILDQVGIDVTVLLGGAAVFGMAVAFGAQALLKDYFSGFIMLMENQYRVGNVVRIGEVAGTVEDVTLRMTVLRDLKGVAHFIPHGQIASVSNLTHGWSRVVFDIGVGYGEDVDQVMKVLMGLARDLREDPDFGPFILGEAEMLGVDAFEDSAVTVKFLVKTRPLQQWVVKRELLRRIKHEFDAQGIEIPFPHRTVYHRKFQDELAVKVYDRPAPRPTAIPDQAAAEDDTVSLPL